MTEAENKAVLLQWEEKFNYCLGLEFSYPAYFEVHHLLVLAYMIQTDGYSYNYFPKAISLLSDFLQNRLSTQESRQEYKSSEKNGITNRSSYRNIAKFDWKSNIMTVRTLSAEQYCEDVREWAKDIIDVVNAELQD